MLDYFLYDIFIYGYEYTQYRYILALYLGYIHFNEKWNFYGGKGDAMNLTIIDTKNILHEYHIDGHKSQWIIGRDFSASDIFIDDNIVSHMHGEFLLKNEKLYYRDLRSCNGTYLENYNQTFLLKDSLDYIEISPYSTLRIGNLHNSNQMIVMLIDNHDQDTKWERKKIDDNQFYIGRNKENDIYLNHPGVSGIHCSISRQGQRYKITHYKSTNGLFINGKSFIGEKYLIDKDVMTIVDFQLIYSDGYIFYRKNVEGLSLAVNHITKTVGKGKKKKRILTNVNCQIKGNEFVAIVGGSGAGKTTLMNIISGFDNQFDGRIFCNGIDLIEQFSTFKHIIGYVPQQDIIYENLTLYKMLKYTAKMRMPNDTENEEINNQIDNVLNTVDLYSHKDTIIKKLSGGQKKRASIAVELLAEPKLFFLDEPTSGLDPGTERNIMYTLQKLTKDHNKTVIIVTHTTLNLHLCDKIIFMNPKGCLTFFGSAKEALSFFKTQDLTDIYNMIASQPDYWQKKYEQSIKCQIRSSSENNENIHKYLSEKNVSLWKQYIILTKRYFELTLRDIPRLLILVLQPFLIALLLYIVSDQDVFTIYDSTKSMLFSLDCAAIWIGLFNSIQEICKERVIVKREYMGNLKLSSYILSKITVLTILGLIQSLILSKLFLFLVNANEEGIFFSNFFFEIFFTIWMTLLAATSLGLLISAIVKSGDKAMTVAPFVLIIQLLFSGILFSLDGTGKWISFLTISRWSVEALGSIAHLNSLSLNIQQDFPNIIHEAESFFEATKIHLVCNLIILIFMIVLFLIGSVLILRNLPNDQR